MHSIELHGDGTLGFVGKISELSWIARACSYLDSPAMQSSNTKENRDDHYSATQFNYYTDDDNLLSIDEDLVDALHWPGDVTVKILSEAFFHALHGIFDSFAREQFLTDLDVFSRIPHPLSWDQRRWLGVANLTWAIASKWLNRSMLNDDPTVEGHLVYYARARALGIDHRIMLNYPGLQGVRASGLLSVYLFINGSINKAWILVGLAMRAAICIGLHLKAADGVLKPSQLEERVRLWYSLYSLEVTVSEVFGKPPSLSLGYTTVTLDALKSATDENASILSDAVGSKKLWLDFLRSRRNVTQTMRGGQVPWQNLQFVGYTPPEQHRSFRVQLSRLSNRVMTELYMPNQKVTWAETQERIGTLDTELAEWEQSLPEDLSLQSVVPTSTDPRAKIDLALYYYSIRMILFRPCLCHIRIQGESDTSKKFNSNSAWNCVYAAISIVDIFPDDPTPHEAYQLLPWAMLLHYLGQVMAIFILELCLNMEHFGNSANHLTPHVTKAMSYLWCLTSNSLSAYKAWRIYRRMLSVVSEQVDGFDITNIPINACVPQAWTLIDETALQNVLQPIGNPGMHH
ncbi:uncharacterized protein A1O9_10096 [Exophiala aquamarina CBS 119918]|uniref:Xylanolytic transcriptional activator regulatory domain-containing protein n=1 Tax=Exophiala aquamarina CBS 119918 TaxID=1182545 RepID=A0A072P1J1_9EURO|nr:uncharacterized protein A1O9_10096 [Exophiala aquamarina CBS 119918]KEF53696.1 hypothetical protein A1O9_10096 [Exophiala aquamarina CBS 119918]